MRVPTGLSVTTSTVAAADPVMVGANETAMTQLLPAGIEAQWVPTTNSEAEEPEMFTSLMLIFFLPTL